MDDVTAAEQAGPVPGGAGEQGLSVDPVESAFVALLQRHPAALVAAIADEGSPTVVPLPEALKAHAGAVAESGPLLGVVVPEDRAVAARLWGEARSQGAAVGRVRRESDPDHPGDLYIFDLRPGHGVMVIAFLPTPSGDESLLEGARLPVPPRFARASKDAGATLHWAEPALSEMLGWDLDELLGRRILELVHPDDREIGIASWMEMLESPGPGRRVRVRHRHRNGSWVWLEVVNHNRLADPEHGDVLAEMMDVSEEMAAHEALRAREQLLGLLTETVPVGLFHADLRGHLLFANRRLHEITGIPIAGTLDELAAVVADEDRRRLEEAVRSARDGAEADVEISIRSAAGAVRHCTVSVRPLKDDTGAVTGLTGCLEDFTDMVRSRRELEAKAASDPLTGCLNREATIESLQEVLDASAAVPRAARCGAAVIFVDLDGFKPVNDRLGHAAGDRLLVRVAARIRASVRAGDVVGRFGGDEFVVVCRDVPGSAEALAIARSLSRRAFRPLRVKDVGTVHIRASMGVAWTDGADIGAGTGAARLIQAADEAMYESKRAALSEPVLAAALDPRAS